MQVYINGEAVTTAAATLAALLKEQGHAKDEVACAINGNFVPRQQHEETALENGLRVEILSPMQGG